MYTYIHYVNRFYCKLLWLGPSVSLLPVYGSTLGLGHAGLPSSHVTVGSYGIEGGSRKVCFFRTLPRKPTPQESKTNELEQCPSDIQQPSILQYFSKTALKTPAAKIRQILGLQHPEDLKPAASQHAKLHKPTISMTL